jgi:hypothetical protein
MQKYEGDDNGKKNTFQPFRPIVLYYHFLFCVHSRPPKPGPDFVWVKPVKGPKGKIIPGHWVYKVAPKPDKIWVKGHYDHKGRWIPGHWKN